ncbi:MAG: DNA primase [Prochlorococcus sp. SP3034]|nr:DNA primase [Prochlorococcus sp. SP3034]|tara:strand:+ start:1400 stop:3436 length:2037 start_codon:yes stop_codon:yes gene_type:complete
MVPSIHPSTIQEVKDKADIVDVISEHVVLKKKGKEFVGICPFHDDNKPSMTVSPSKQFYYCFSCGAGGNSIKFLMEFTRNNFADVVLSLAKKNDINIKTIDGPQNEAYKRQLTAREELYKVLRISKDWFKSQLYNSSGKNALEYITNIRNLNKSTIDEFEIGYAPNSWTDLYDYLTKVEKISLESILKAGLVISKEKENKTYDRFRNRLIVPIFDSQGRVVAFGGRSLDGSEPKYLNSPESEIFEKGKLLFSFHKASSNIRKNDKAIVVEGYFDVITLHSKGINNCVASLGTALSKYQISQLCRCTDNKNIVINFDSDNAGNAATKRIISEVESLSLNQQINLKILQLSGFKDPDEYLSNHSSNDYLNLVDQAKFWIDWELDQIFLNKDISKADNFQNVVSLLVKFLSKLTQSAIRTHYLQKVSERLSMGQARLAIKFEEDLRQQVKGFRWHGRSQKFELPHEITQREKNESQIIFYYLHCPELRIFIRKELFKREIQNFSINHHQLIWSAISKIEEDSFGKDYLIKINDKLNSNLINDFKKLDLLFSLPDFITINNHEIINKLAIFINPDELFLTTLSNPKNNLLGTLSLLERYKSLKRCRHLISSWSSQRLKTLENCISILITNNNSESSDSTKEIDDLFKDLNSDALKFQELYYLERQHIISLDKQRCGNYVFKN